MVMTQQKIDMSCEIISDDFPSLNKNIKEYEQHCVTYLIHNDKQIYVGETSNLKLRFKDHQKSKEKFKLIKTKIIVSDFFNKSAVYDIESRLINYIYADGKFDVINIKTQQRSHNYYLKEEINDQLFRKIWNKLQDNQIANQSLLELENSHLFKYSPFKEFSDSQLDVIKKVVNEITEETPDKSIAFDGSITEVRTLNKSGKRVLIEGGPGTGKTLLIVKIVHNLIKQHQIDPKAIAVCIPQSNLLKTFRKMFRAAKIKVDLIKPIDISKVKPKYYDLLIIDETHRLKQHFNKQAKDLKHLKNGEITELDYALENSKNLVLMYDSKQTVRPADISHQHILGIKDITKHTLLQQFRVKKGFDYLRFIENLLQINNQKPDATHLGDYELKVVDDIRVLQSMIKQKEETYGLCRLASGYYKKWISKNDSKLYDFEDEGLKCRWNTTIEGWVTSENALDEVGCIHTLQGEDLNYAGVIMGDEIYLDPKDQKIKIRKECYFDKNGTPLIGKDPTNAELEKYIKNIYYVLLTRGMGGTFIYAKDTHLRDYLKNSLK
jgi:hypothetical protein